jgi:hypothetical protein
MRLVKATPEQDDSFAKHFGVSLGTFVKPPLLDFNIFKFEDWLVTKGYEKYEEVSIKDFVTEKYGQEATDLVSDLLGIGLTSKGDNK